MDQLLTQAMQGDEGALCELLEAIGTQIRLGLQIGPKWQGLIEPDDVMQVTYLEAFLRIGDFTAATVPGFRQWLRRIAENNLRDAIRELECDKRGHKVERSVSEDSHTTLLAKVVGTQSTPSRIASRREIQDFVEDGLQRLPREYAQVVRLCEIEGKTGPEAAAIMQRSHGAIRMLLCRAKDRLREVLISGSAFFSDTA